MTEIDQIKSHDQFAPNYDSQVKEFNSYGHDVLFGMCYEFISADDLLLDLGIGTGLSSIHFAKAGCHVFGLDGSAGMLDECRKKGFAKELQQYNIQDVPLPFPNESFSIIICCGVFHFFSDLQPIIRESFRLLKDSGIMAFTISSFQKSQLKDKNSIPDYIEVSTAWAIPIFKHSDSYINNMVKVLGFSVIKEQKILSDSGDKSTPDILFKAIVLQK
jgi:ubiquinone/menaquinone biosynthesis C-methylase UbiE